MNKIMKAMAVMSLVTLLGMVLIGCDVDFSNTAAQPGATITRYTPQPYVKLRHPDWLKNAAVYQINTRQFTPEGTFAAAAEHLPRLKALGVDVLWLMPIHPIGEVNRKGTLGSPYSVKDYFAVNPEFGSEDDFRDFVDAAHALGLKVILDWVANHTAWDNALVDEHPDWYLKDWDGDFQPTAWFDWSDIIDLDYSKPEVREYMTDALKYWVQEFDIDGYRCDVAWGVPLDFWVTARRELDAIKPVFMLAEAEFRDFHAEAFDMTYGWSWRGPAHSVAKGDSGVGAYFGYYSTDEKAWPKDAYRLLGVSNHDYNAWDGTAFEVFGDNLEPTIVLTVVGSGVPMIYNGQEAGLDKRLAFFEKDAIAWREHSIGDLYTKLFALMHENTALWHGAIGGTMVRVWHDKPDQVLSFVRDNGDDKVLAFMNFSTEAQQLTVHDGPVAGDYTEYFSGEQVSIALGSTVWIEAHGYRVFVQ